jgi:hypothetical protein
LHADELVVLTPELASCPHVVAVRVIQSPFIQIDGAVQLH